MSETDFSSLSRPIHPMPVYVKEALIERGLLNAYRSRPPYQQNDYIGWINRAKRLETKQKRLNQMLDELEPGDVYMKMPYRPRAPNDETLKALEQARTRQELESFDTLDELFEDLGI